MERLVDNDTSTLTIAAILEFAVHPRGHVHRIAGGGRVDGRLDVGVVVVGGVPGYRQIPYVTGAFLGGLAAFGGVEEVAVAFGVGKADGPHGHPGVAAILGLDHHLCIAGERGGGRGACPLDDVLPGLGADPGSLCEHVSVAGLEQGRVPAAGGDACQLGPLVGAGVILQHPVHAAGGSSEDADVQVAVVHEEMARAVAGDGIDGCFGTPTGRIGGVGRIKEVPRGASPVHHHEQLAVVCGLVVMGCPARQVGGDVGHLRPASTPVAGIPAVDAAPAGVDRVRHGRKHPHLAVQHRAARLTHVRVGRAGHRTGCRRRQPRHARRLLVVDGIVVDVGIVVLVIPGHAGRPAVEQPVVRSVIDDRLAALVVLIARYLDRLAHLDGIGQQPAARCHGACHYGSEYQARCPHFFCSPLV